MLIVATANAVMYAEIVVECGANINYQLRKTKKTALMVAAVRHCKMEVVNFLVSRGADPTLKDADGKTVFDLLDEQIALSPSMPHNIYTSIKQLITLKTKNLNDCMKA